MHHRNMVHVGALHQDGLQTGSWVFWERKTIESCKNSRFKGQKHTEERCQLYTWLATIWISILSGVKNFLATGINTPTHWPTALALCLFIAPIWFALRNVCTKWCTARRAKDLLSMLLTWCVPHFEKKLQSNLYSHQFSLLESNLT